MTGKIVVLVGQIASGKTTLARYLEQCGFERIVTCTTRPPRDGEKDGEAYRFLTEDAFRKALDDGYFAEYTEYDADFGHCCYGTSRKSLETPGGVNKVIVLNPRGATALKKAGYDIFILWLDFEQEALMARALQRGDTPAEIGRRIAEDSRLFRLLEQEGIADLRVTDPNLRPDQIADLLHDIP